MCLFNMKLRRAAYLGTCCFSIPGLNLVSFPQVVKTGPLLTNRPLDPTPVLNLPQYDLSEQRQGLLGLTSASGRS